MSNKYPNYDNTVGKHPIPHAKGIAKNENSSMDNPKERVSNSKTSTEEE